jgi:hypothetical protein
LIDTNVGVGDGKKTITLTMHVIDGRTRNPIDGATVELRDKSAEVDRAREPGSPLVLCRTNSGGEAPVRLVLPLVVRAGIFHTSTRLYCSEGLTLVVKDSTHGTTRCGLADRLGASFRPRPDDDYRVDIAMSPGR